MSLLIGLPSVSEGAAKVVLNEVQYHPANDVRAGEFVELFNHGSEDVDLGDWILYGGILYAFPRGTVLPAGRFLVVAADRSALLGLYPDLNPLVVIGNYTRSLSNDEDRVELWTKDGYLMSFISYSDAEPWPESADGLGPTLERISALREEHDAEAWAASIPIGGTPGSPNSVRIADPVQPGTAVTYVPQGATWKYFRGVEEPGAAWAAIGFDDTAWNSGPAGFGYDDNDDATVLSDMRNGYSTVYVRRSFEVSSPDAVESLTLSVLYDDGYVAYLNGVEVDRTNVTGTAGTPLPYTATTPSTVEPPPTREVDLAPFLSLLVEGENVLSVQGVNAARDNPDFSLHPSLRAVVQMGLPRDATFIDVGSEWRFFRGTSAPPAEWAELSFVDGEWEAGPSGIGYGDGDDATVLADMQDNYLTVFLRQNFQVRDASKVASLILSMNYDDGFIAYVNGIEVARANVATAGFDTPAGTSHEAGSAVDFAVADFATLLRTGVNALAIEVHNSRLDSTDLSAIPVLRGSILPDDPTPPPDPPPARPARAVVVNEIFVGSGGNGWVELFNTADSAVSIGGSRLQLFPASSGSYEFPSGTIIGARDRLVVDESALGFPLAGIACLILGTEEGFYLDSLNPRTAPAGLSSGAWPDGATNRYVFATPTRDAPNAVELETRVVLNEVQFHPGDSNLGGEYVELHNRSTTSTVDISGWSFTRGIEYTFPASTQIGPGGFLVLARDPAAAASYYGIPTPYGPYAGRLRNDAETLLLRDGLKNPADRVRFADEGSWPEDADGLGPSAELVHPLLENRYGPAWAASTGEGTPGAANSSFAADPAPIVVAVAHEPVLPTPTDTVRVTATISDERGIVSASLFWQVDGTGSPTEVAMVDDGVGDDGLAGNGIWGARIPARADRSIVLFWIRATAVGGTVVTAPLGAPSPAMKYQVEAPGAEEARPLYRVVMTAADLQSLQTRGVTSNVLLDVTFLTAGKAWYNRGIRYRGQSSRYCSPLSYRVQFDHDIDYFGIKRLDLNGCNAQRQWIGLDYLSRTGVATPQAWYRKLSLNGTRQTGMLLRVEAVDDQFLERNFPDDDSGNLYRGQHNANLDYRGTAFSSYTADYEKTNNEEEADWSDIVELCRAFDSDTTSDADFPAAIEAAIDVDQWALYFAAYALLGSTEGSILRDNGDDYFLYHRPSDGRWILLPWDLDSCFDESTQVLFRPTVDQIERFLEHPRYAPIYWCAIQTILDGAFQADVVDSRVDHLVPLFNATLVGQLRQYAPARRAYVQARLRTELTVNVASGGRLCGRTILATGGNLALDGFAPGCGTTSVVVGGIPAAYNPQTNQWSISLPFGGAGILQVSAVDREGLLVDRHDLVVEAPSGGTTLQGTIATSTILSPAGSPYRVVGLVTVAAAAELRIEPGVHLVFDGGASLLVNGTLVAEGDDEESVLFSADACTQGTEGIVLAGAGTSRLSRCEISGLLGAAGQPAGIARQGTGILEIDRCTIGGSGGGGSLLSMAGGRIHATSSLFSDAARGFAATGGVLVLENSVLRELGTEALQVSGGASAEVRGCLFIADTTAIRATAQGSATIDHVTIHGCGTGLAAAEPSPGTGGGTLTVSNAIVWATSTPLAVDAESTAGIEYSNLAGGVPSGEGNISADPVFADAAAGDYRLSFFSPSRATGRDGSDMGAFPYVSLGESGSFIRCDSNGDGDNDLSDGIFTLLHLFGGGDPAPCPPALDCNADAEVNVTDVIFNLTHLFLAGDPPPAPYPGCEASPVESCPGLFCSGS